MATIAQENYKFVLGMPLVEATSFYPPISTRLLAEGIFASTIRSGWGASQPGGTEILLEIEFTVDKGFRTDAQIQALASDIAGITSTPLLQIVTLSLAHLVPATPAPTVTAPSTVVGTDISGVISVGAVGTANIVLTFGTAYLLVPVVVASWSTNLCQVSTVATVSNVTFKSNNATINGEKINYICT